METGIRYENGKFYIGNMPLRCGKKIELLIKGNWVLGRIRYHSNYCFYNDIVGDIELQDGMKIKIIS